MSKLVKQRTRGIKSQVNSNRSKLVNGSNISKSDYNKMLEIAEEDYGGKTFEFTIVFTQP